MLVEAIRRAIGAGIPREKIKIKAVLGDFTELRRFEIAYEERRHNNVFSLLGNSLGNSDEAELLDAIANSLFPGDFALLEVNVGDANKTLALTNDPSNIEHDFTPLRSIGAEFDPTTIKYELDSTLSTLPNTKSVVAVCTTANCNGKTFTDVKLSIVHHYDFESLKRQLPKKLRADLKYSAKQDDVALFLLQRPTKGK